MTTPCAEGMRLPLPAADDAEGDGVDPRLPMVVDAHVHLFPPKLFEAIWRWFDTHGWPIRYKLHADEVVAFLRARGVRHMVALHYAHKAGMAEAMNDFMRETAARHPDVTGLATVFPGEPGSGAIVDRAIESGLRGVKLHCHVQCFAPDEDRLADVYEACVRHDVPLVMHAGREPKSDAYKVDTHAVCAAERTARVLAAYPTLKLCVPHLGADEFDDYARLLERHDNLWLDTTMMLGHYFGIEPPHHILSMRPSRILYGTDFPNLPYAWDRELQHLESWGIAEHDLPLLLGENARQLFGLSLG